MSVAAATRPRRRYGRIAAAGLVALVALSTVMAVAPGWLQPLQLAWFDACQRWFPRSVSSMPATVVAVDEGSLARLGQWPWPRTTLAELVRAIARHDPAAIGVDLLMSEPDRLSPERLPIAARERDPVLAERLKALPANDDVLADALRDAPVVLGMAGMPESTGRVPLGPPILVATSGRGAGSPSVDRLHIARFPGVLRNLDVLDRAAAGHGVLSAAPEEQVIRRLPLVVRLGDRLAPSFGVELLRVALGAPDVRLSANGSRVEGVAIGDLALPTETDGALRLNYAHRDARRVVSAVDVLEGRVDPERLARKFVVIGTSALATVDYQLTPLGERMPGSEIHAQLLENVFEASWLMRPWWTQRFEVAAFALLGLAMVGFATRGWGKAVAAVGLAGTTLVVMAALAAFAGWRLVFDAATPALALLVLFSILAASMLAEARRHRLALEQAIRLQREREARVAGELDAAKRIQLGFLPRADAFADDRRIAIAASMTPAREVGGDLYDFFRLDADRVFFVIGDVAGKGLSASLFMAVSKALYKSTALRGGAASVGELMQVVDVEVSRDNAEMFFVTAFAGILDLASGELEYCNAGHDNPLIVRAADGTGGPVDDGAGPPLCAVECFPYRSAKRRLRPGDLLCLYTDGIVDARNPAGERYGFERLGTVIVDAARDRATPDVVVERACADVRRFMAGTEPVDDYSVLAIRWNGSAVDTPPRAPVSG